MENARFLLHICCAPCSPHVIRELKKQFDVALYFYNPNIHPTEEYFRRLEEARKVAAIENTALHTGEYRHEQWAKTAEQWKDEPERGRRCEYCIGDRLVETARKADELGISLFGTVLTLSRLKSAVMINGLGEKAAENFDGVEFFRADWKKKDGFNISAKISGEIGLKRQDYCGCRHSMRRTNKEPVATGS